MHLTHKIIICASLCLLIVAAVGLLLSLHDGRLNTEELDPSPQSVTLSGTYVCLPHLDTTGPQTEECAFGLMTDDGVYYAVNFGASATAMEQFRSGAHVVAEGFTVIKEALSTDQWAKYNMKGIFTVTKIIR